MGITERKNVIVVGAGASKEFGLPTGEELKEQIARISNIRFDDVGFRLASGDPDLVATLQLLAAGIQTGQTNINPYLHAAWKIRDNMPLAPSIDNFLDTHRKDDHVVEFGKLAIAKAISAAEKCSNLYIDHRTANPRLYLSKVSKTWIARFFSILVAKMDFLSFLDALRNITFISFNYDRCIEQFIVNAARSYFAIGASDVEEVASSIDVVFPYGSLGALNWKSQSSNGFGGNLNDQILIDVSKGLKTFTEGSETNDIEKINKIFADAGLVMFLGFGFLDLNMRILSHGAPYKVLTIIGTANGMSTNSRESVKKEISNMFKLSSRDNRPIESDVGIHDITCSDLIFEYERDLSASA